MISTKNVYIIQHGKKIGVLNIPFSELAIKKYAILNTIGSLIPFHCLPTNSYCTFTTKIDSYDDVMLCHIR
jgi:hypothetical protein